MDGSGENLLPINVSFSSLDLLLCGSESQEGIPNRSRDIELGQGEFGVGTVFCLLSDFNICSAVSKIKWFPREQDPCHTPPDATVRSTRENRTRDGRDDGLRQIKAKDVISRGAIGLPEQIGTGQIGSSRKAYALLRG